jgi:hypothetical protein
MQQAAAAIGMLRYPQKKALKKFPDITIQTNTV